MVKGDCEEPAILSSKSVAGSSCRPLRRLMVMPPTGTEKGVVVVVVVDDGSGGGGVVGSGNRADSFLNAALTLCNGWLMFPA